MRPFYRESPCEKSGMCRATAARPARSVKTGSGNRRRGHYVPRVTDAREAVRVSQSFVQLIGFVVLAAIILATGFGAIGAPPVRRGF